MRLLKVLSWAFLTAAFIFAAAPSYADDDDGYRGIGDTVSSIFTGDNGRYDDDDDDDDDDRRWGRDRDDDDDDDDRRWGRDRDNDDDDDDDDDD